MRTDGIRLWVFRAWDGEWVAECSGCGEVHWDGGWMDAMVAAWGHLSMAHPLPRLRRVPLLAAEAVASALVRYGP